jgi:hypothetical protein
VNVRVGFGGDKNFMQHEGSAKHKSNAKKMENGPKSSKKLTSFFGPHTAPINRPPVPPAPLALPPTIASKPVLASPEIIDVDTFDMTIETDSTPIEGSTSKTTNSSFRPPFRNGEHPLLRHLRLLTLNLPSSVPIAKPTDELAQFAGDLVLTASSVDEVGENPWEVLVDPFLNRTIGYGKSTAEVAEIVRRGDLGMDAFYRWIKICLEELKVLPSLLEMMLERVFDAMKLLYVFPFSGPTP